jgi:hypothetical protein
MPANHATPTFLELHRELSHFLDRLGVGDDDNASWSKQSQDQVTNILRLVQARLELLRHAGLRGTQADFRRLRRLLSRLGQDGLVFDVSDEEWIDTHPEDVMPRLNEAAISLRKLILAFVTVYEPEAYQAVERHMRRRAAQTGRRVIWKETGEQFSPPPATPASPKRPSKSTRPIFVTDRTVTISGKECGDSTRPTEKQTPTAPTKKLSPHMKSAKLDGPYIRGSGGNVLLKLSARHQTLLGLIWGKHRVSREEAFRVFLTRDRETRWHSIQKAIYAIREKLASVDLTFTYSTKNDQIQCVWKFDCRR